MDNSKFMEMVYENAFEDEMSKIAGGINIGKTYKNLKASAKRTNQFVSGAVRGKPSSTKASRSGAEFGQKVRGTAGNIKQKAGAAASSFNESVVRPEMQNAGRRVRRDIRGAIDSIDSQDVADKTRGFINKAYEGGKQKLKNMFSKQESIPEPQEKSMLITDIIKRHPVASSAVGVGTLGAGALGVSAMGKEEK